MVKVDDPKFGLQTTESERSPIKVAFIKFSNVLKQLLITVHFYLSRLKSKLWTVHFDH